MTSLPAIEVLSSLPIRSASRARSGRVSRAVHRTIPREPLPQAFSIFNPVTRGKRDTSTES